MIDRCDSSCVILVDLPDSTGRGNATRPVWYRRSGAGTEMYPKKNTKGYQEGPKSVINQQRLHDRRQTVLDISDGEQSGIQVSKAVAMVI